MKSSNSSNILFLVAAINVVATGVVFFKPSHTDKLFSLYEISVAGLYGTYQLRQSRFNQSDSEGEGSDDEAQ